jgi:hypothetical protein
MIVPVSISVVAAICARCSGVVTGAVELELLPKLIVYFPYCDI